MPDALAAFQLDESLPHPLPESPITLMRAWYDEACTKRLQPNPNAITLATATVDGAPSARIVLCKAILDDPGAIVFYTNYDSRKGRELANNPRAAAVFHWDALDRQVRIEGVVEKSPPEESDAYFRSRAWEKRVGAWASKQSEPLASRDELTDRVFEAIGQLDVDLPAALRGDPVDIPRPPHWGGYRLIATAVELWLGNPGRIHDRARWTRTLHTPATPPTPWTATRLFP